MNQVAAVVDRARKRGALHAEALLTQAEGWDLEFFRGKMTWQQRATEDSLRVRVWTSGATGSATGRWAEADKVVDRAFTSVVPADPTDGPVQRVQPLTVGLSIQDRRWEMLGIPDRQEVLAEAEHAIRIGDPRVTLEPFRWFDRAIVRSFANDRGLVGREPSNVYRVLTGLTIGGAAPHHLRGGLEARTFASMSSLPFGGDLGRRAQALLAPEREVHGPVRVLLSSTATAWLLDQLARLCVPAVADRSFLASVSIDPRIHLLDDPLLSAGLRTRAFDDRGVPPVPVTLLREGRLHGRYLDPLTALRGDLRPTGHVTGDALSPSNLVLRAGSRSVHVILGELVGPTFSPDDLSTLTLDPATGRMEGVVSGTVFHGAEAVGAVLRRRLTGEAGVVLARLHEISNETDRVGHVDAPPVILDGFSLE